MIRTRDFALFAFGLLFFSAAIAGTLISQSWGHGLAETAAVANFAPPAAVTGATAPRPDDDPTATISRLRAKIAAGDGDVAAGGPVFTSVDDVATATSAPVITDQVDPTSVLIGRTLDGQPLMSDDLWRFVGFSQTDQIGVAENGHPIFGPRADGLALDACGGADDGSGYRLYFDPSRSIAPACYIQ